MEARDPSHDNGSARNSWCSTKPPARWWNRRRSRRRRREWSAAVCQALGWQCGAIWEANRARQVMRCVGTWHTPGLPIEEFTAATQASTFARGIGLPGRVWAAREPAWIPDVTADDNFPRAAVAQRVGLHAAFALPIMQGRRVQGVMEFFSRHILQPSPDLLAR